MAAFIAPLIQAAIHRNTEGLGQKEADALHSLYGTQPQQASTPYGPTPAPAMTPQPFDPNTVGNGTPPPKPQGRRMFGMPPIGTGTG